MMKCDTICGRVLNCGKHFCKASCHGGSCEPCEEIIVKGYYCYVSVNSVTCLISIVFNENNFVHMCKD